MKIVLGLLIVVLVAIWSVWPMVQNPSRIPDFGSDGLLLIWIMNQPKLFQGNIFYPYKNTLAYSDRLLLSRFSTRLPVLISGNPAVAFGFALVLGQILTMIIIYLFWLYEYKNPLAAALGTIAFGLSQIRFEYQVHLQMWNMQYWLLGILLLWRNPRPWKIYLGFLLLGLQFWESPLPVYFSLLVLSTKYLVLRPKINKHYLWGLLLMGLIISPMAKTYLDVAHEFSFQRDIREAAHNSLSVNDLWGRFSNPGLYVLFFGFALPILFKAKSKQSKFWIIIVALFTVLALGPVLKFQDKTIKIFGLPIPLPYSAAYYSIPGFGAMRTPSRWLIVSGLGLSGLLIFVMTQKKFTNMTILCMACIAVAGGSRISKTKDLQSPKNYPPVYSWLATQPGEVVLELPVYTWEHEGVENYRMLYSLISHKNLVNGYSGFTPPEIYSLSGNPAKIPAEVNYVIVHLDEGGKWNQGLKVWQDMNTEVYKL